MNGGFSRKITYKWFIFHSNVELPEGIVQYGHRQLLKFIAMQYQRTTKRDLNNAHVCLTYDIAYSKMHLR